MAETKVTEEHAEVEGFLSAFGEGVVLSLLWAQTNRGAEFDLPADTRTVQKKYVGACGATKIQVSDPVLGLFSWGLPRHENPAYG